MQQVSIPTTKDIEDVKGCGLTAFRDGIDDDDEVDDEGDDILCCDFIVLSVCLLQSPPWYTVFNASLKVFHLVIMMAMMVGAQCLKMLLVESVDQSINFVFSL